MRHSVSMTFWADYVLADNIDQMASFRGVSRAEYLKEAVTMYNQQVLLRRLQTLVPKLRDRHLWVCESLADLQHDHDARRLSG